MSEMKSTVETRILGAVFGYTVLAMTVGAGLFAYGVLADSQVFARWGAGVFFSPIGVMAYGLVVQCFLEFMLPDGLQALRDWQFSKVEAVGMLAFNVWAACGLVAMPVTVGAWLAGWETVEMAGWYVLLGCLTVGLPVLIVGVISLVAWTTLNLDTSRSNG